MDTFQTRRNSEDEDVDPLEQFEKLADLFEEEPEEGEEEDLLEEEAADEEE